MQDDIQCELTKLKSRSDDDGLSFEQIVSDIVSGVVHEDENLYDDETICMEDEETEGHCERQTYVYVSILSEIIPRKNSRKINFIERPHVSL